MRFLPLSTLLSLMHNHQWVVLLDVKYKTKDEGTAEEMKEKYGDKYDVLRVLSDHTFEYGATRTYIKIQLDELPF